MQCQEARSNVYSYLDHELDSQRERLLFCHLSSCPKCHEELEKSRELDQLLRESCSLIDPPEELGLRIMAKVTGQEIVPRQGLDFSGEISEVNPAAVVRLRRWRYALGVLAGAAAMTFFVLSGGNLFDHQLKSPMVGLTEAGLGSQQVQETARTATNLPVVQPENQISPEKVPESGATAETADQQQVQETADSSRSSEDTTGQEATSQTATAKSPGDQDASSGGMVTNDVSLGAQKSFPKVSTAPTVKQTPNSAAGDQQAVENMENVEEYPTILSRPDPGLPDPNGLLTIAGSFVSLEAKPVVLGDAGALAPTWTKEGIKYLARQEGSFGLWSAKSDGSKKSNLLTLAETNATNFSWSSSGDLLAYQFQRDGTSYIKIVDSQGASKEIEGFDPAWSSGGELAFARTTPDGIALVSYTTAAGEDVLTVSAEEKSALTWSPDGSKLGYASHGSEGISLAAVTRGQKPVVLTDTLRTGKISLYWSPDGQKLVYNLGTGAKTGGMWLVSMDGSVQKQLAESADGVIASWSPDGQKIAYSNGEGILNLIYLAPEGEGRKTVKITTEADSRNRINVMWDNTSNRILFDWQKAGEASAVWLANLPQDSQS